MGTGFDYGQIIFIAIGVYCAIRGFMILATGKIGEKEEAAISAYSPEGRRRYKLLSAGINIVGGVFIVIVDVLKMMNMIDRNIYRILLIAAVIVMLAVYFIVRNSCKNVK